MKNSFNEIESTMRKAAIGSGWPEGVAEHLGRAAAYLERRGLCGIEPILRVIERGPLPADPEIVSNRAVIRAKGGLAAVAAFDFLAASSVQRVELHDVCSADALIGLAGAAALEYECGFLLDFGRNSCVKVYKNRIFRNEPQVAASGSVFATMLPHEEFRSEFGDRRDIGIAVWRKSQALAALTLVPSTDASRRLGAGAGLQDND